MKPSKSIEMRAFVWVAFTCAALLLVAANNRADGSQMSAEQRAIHRFGDAVRTYAALHHQLERSLPPLEMTDDMEKLYESIDALADSIRAARAQAREGDIFGRELSMLLRIRIDKALRDRGLEISDLLADMTTDVPIDAERPRVNERFPWEWSAAVPLCLFDVLPELPDDLEYRFAGRDLVLVDIHAELVVDILRGALPSPDPGRTLTSLEIEHDLLGG
jgi:hypothetical protein